MCDNPREFVFGYLTSSLSSYLHPTTTSIITIIVIIATLELTIPRLVWWYEHSIVRYSAFDAIAWLAAVSE